MFFDIPNLKIWLRAWGRQWVWAHLCRRALASYPFLHEQTFSSNYPCKGEALYCAITLHLKKQRRRYVGPFCLTPPRYFSRSKKLLSEFALLFLLRHCKTSTFNTVLNLKH